MLNNKYNYFIKKNYSLLIPISYYKEIKKISILIIHASKFII